MDYLKPASVLIIDDDQINNFIAERLISKASKDTRILICQNGRAALEMLFDIQNNEGQFPEYIFLDLTMRIMDGWSFLDDYKLLDEYLTSKTRIIILTSSIFEHDMKRAGEHLVENEYIIKPLTSERLTLLFAD